MEVVWHDCATRAGVKIQNSCSKFTLMSEVYIRPFLPSDQSAVQAIILAGLEQHFGYIDPTLNPDLTDIWQSYVQPGHTFVVAEVAGQLVGTGALVQENPADNPPPPVWGRLVRMSVSQPYRRLGIGRALVAHLVQEGEEKGFGRLWVETNFDWVDAIRLYERCGFVEYARDDESVYLARACNEWVLSGV